MPLSNEQRKAMVKAQRGMQRSLCRKLRLSPSHVSMVISGDRPATPMRLKNEIARRLQLPVEEVFPPDVQQSA